MPAIAHRLFVVTCLLSWVWAVTPTHASVILNALESNTSDEPGWSGRVDGLMSGSGGNTEQFLIETGAQVRWQADRDRVRLQLSGGYRESNNVETARNLVAHMRHNRQWSGPWSTVSFVQIQHNPFQRLNSRWLVGLGPRYDFTRDAKGAVAVGATAMLEIERLKGEAGHLSRGRLSTFLHVARQLSANTKLDAVGFWQPLFSDFSASRAVGNLTLTVQISGQVDLKVGAGVQDNARPPEGVKRTDWSTFTGLGVSF